MVALAAIAIDSHTKRFPCAVPEAAVADSVHFSFIRSNEGPSAGHQRKTLLSWLISLSPDLAFIVG
jgi:hypothetical protein